MFSLGLWVFCKFTNQTRGEIAGNLLLCHHYCLQWGHECEWPHAEWMPRVCVMADEWHYSYCAGVTTWRSSSVTVTLHWWCSSEQVTGLPPVGLGQDLHSQVTDSFSFFLTVAHTWLPSIGFRSLSRFLAVSLQVTWVIDPTVGCHYFPPGLQLPPQPLRGLLPVSLLGEQRHDGCEHHCEK